ncbi:hypothetical protein KIN20_025538 [Parelaphostrongylus tenuis]|uniref:Innexin n=1 Tax=Parelaphostrongylus tenuis TaxID=148309 RepID=A0AAD5MZK9_PARTN|nr:hypothetical protein KIN20_025538 [Parelaphostrongylus tenuis]
MVLGAVLSMLRYVAGSEDRDFVDRLHSYFTCNILIGLAVLVSFKQFGGKPIECLVPDMFSSSWEQYAENYCWAQDTYFVPMSEVVAGMSESVRRQRRISYYQSPSVILNEVEFMVASSSTGKKMNLNSKRTFILVGAVFSFWSKPLVFDFQVSYGNTWLVIQGSRFMRWLNCHRIQTISNPISKEQISGRLQYIYRVHFVFHRRLRRKQIRPHSVLTLFNLPYSAFFVTTMYLCTKFFYLTNVCFQLLLMNKFLGTTKYSWYGFGVILDLWNGTTWQKSGVFPRVSLCDFEVRVMGNVQEHTVQCVLVINIFNEKIFIFLWFWYLMLVFFTLSSFLYWLFVAIVPFINRRFINRHLEISEMPFDPSASAQDVRRFIDSYLRSDGIFVIRTVTFQSGVIFGTELVLALWKSFLGLEDQLKRSNSVPDFNKSPDGHTYFWPPPGVCDEREHQVRRALGQNIDNSEITQDFLQRVVPPYKCTSNRYAMLMSAPQSEEDSQKEALIKNRPNINASAFPKNIVQAEGRVILSRTSTITFCAQSVFRVRLVDVLS